MELRGAIEQVLAGLQLGTHPTEVLDDLGFGDVPPDAIASALVHFAESADLELADALSPIITRISEVPFEEGDLTPIDTDEPLPDSGDVFAMLTEVGLGGHDLAAMVDEDVDLEDLDDFDQLDEFDELSESADAGYDAEDSDGDDGESTYGAGNEVEELVDETEDADDQADDGDLGTGIDDLTGEGAELLDGVEDALPEELESTFGELLEHDDHASDDYDDEDDTDPSDLDLDLD
jgi:hypothetical protein